MRPGSRIPFAGKCLQLLRSYEVPFELSFLSMGPGYSVEAPWRTARRLDIPLTILRRISLPVRKQKTPPVCAAMRRGHLQQAQLMGCNKIALGHHYDDD